MPPSEPALRHACTLAAAGFVTFIVLAAGLAAAGVLAGMDDLWFAGALLAAPAVVLFAIYLILRSGSSSDSSGDDQHR